MIHSDFGSRSCHFLIYCFSWLLVGTFTAGWEHCRKYGQLYRNSEVATLSFTHAITTNSFSCSKNLRSFPVVSVTIAWLIYAASVDSEAREAGDCLYLKQLCCLVPCLHVDIALELDTRFYCSFVLVCSLIQVPTFQTASSLLPSLECFTLVLACVFDKPWHDYFSCVWWLLTVV